MKFRTKLTLLFVAIVLFLTIVDTLFVYYSNLAILEAQIKNRLKDDAFHIMNKIDRMLFERFSDIKAIASDPNISSTATMPQQITERLIEYRNSYKTYLSLSFFDLNRRRIADTAGLDIGDRHPLTPGWERVFKDEDFIMEISKSKSVGNVSFHFLSLVKNRNGHPIGVVLSSMPVERLYDIVRETFLFWEDEGEVKIDLVDKNGLLIYSTYNRQGILKDRFKELGATEGFSPGRKTGSLLNFHKEEYIHTIAKEQGHLDFKGNGWTSHIQIPTRMAFAPVVELRNKIIAVGLGIGLFSIVVILFFSRTISQPIIRLRDAAVEIGKGNLDVKTNIRSKDEIGQLAASFNAMVENLKSNRDQLLAYSSELETKVSKRTAQLQDINEQLRVELVERKKAEEALQESRERYRTLFENVPIGFYRTAEDGRIIDANPALVEMLSYPDRESLMAINTTDTYVDLEARTERQNMLKHKTFLKGYEIQLRRYDGSVLWVEDNVRVIHRADGRILYYEGSLRDITERKQAEEEREKLIRELQEALARIKTLSGLLPICASCKKIRDDKGYWTQIESYITKHSEADFSHGICPDCMKKLYPDIQSKEK